MKTAAAQNRCASYRDRFDAFLGHQLPKAESTRVRLHLDSCQDCWSAWNTYRWLKALDTELGQALRHFLGEDFLPFHDSSKALAAAWDAAESATPAERADFFRTSTDYLYNSTVWTASGNRPPYVRQAQPVLERLHVRKLIDYGCGIGEDTLALLHSGYAVIACDYHSPSTRFLEWRAAREGLSVRPCEPGELEVPADTDALWIIDTLDHLPNPGNSLRDALATVRVVITEDVHTARAHGNQRFHHRKSPEELVDFFFSHYFTPEQPTELTAHLTVWRRCGTPPPSATRPHGSA